MTGVGDGNQTADMLPSCCANNPDSFLLHTRPSHPYDRAVANVHRVRRYGSDMFGPAGERTCPHVTRLGLGITPWRMSAHYETRRIADIANATKLNYTCRYSSPIVKVIALSTFNSSVYRGETAKSATTQNTETNHLAG